MIIDNPIVSGSLNVQNNVTASNGLFTNNLTVEGTIYGAISGSSATASYVEYENVANKPTLVSSSAQLADDISGSFTSLSSSIASDRLKNTTDTLTGDLTVTGTLTAQDLVVQEITSSIIYSSGSNKFGNELSNSHNFTGSVNITGSLNVNGAEVGTGKLDETVFNAYTSSTDTRLDNLEATGSDQESRIDTLEGKTLISSSAQIGTEISGAFTDVSSSFSTRVTNLEDFSSSLDATFATDADLNLVSASVDNILAATSSYALSASISGAFTSVSSSIAADIEDIIDGTTTVASASHAVSSLTASYALNAGAGAGFPFSGSAIITGSLEVSGSTISGSFIGDGSGLTGITVSSTNTVTSSFSSTGSVTILHSFNSKNVSVSVYDDNDILIIPQQVTLLDNNNVKIDFGGNTTGFAVLAKGGHLVSGSVPVPQLSTVTDSFSSTTSHTVTHNFGTKEVIVSVYENDELIIPDSITTPTTDTVTVSFPEAISGRVVVVKAGHIVSGSIPFSNLLDSPFISGSGAITASGHLVPSENETYDLGSSTKRWRDIYLSGSSIYLGNTVITEGNIVTTGSLSGSLPAGVISGSAQIATEISGAFTSVSSSFASGRLKNTTDTLTGDLTVTGTLTAQDLHVQEVTSSIIYSSGSNIFGNSTSDTQTFNGGVGIGIAPYSTAQLSIDSGTRDYILYGQSSDANAFISLRDDSSNTNVIFGAVGNNHVFMKDTTEHMRINSSGQVGIGTNSIFTGTELDVWGDIVLAQQNWALRGNAGNADFAIEELAGGAFNDSNIKFTIETGGNVGINSTTPNAMLDVRPNANTSYTSNTVDAVRIGRTAAGRPSISFDTSDTSYTNRVWFIENYGPAASLNFGRNGLDVMSLRENGDVFMTNGWVPGNPSKLTIRGEGTYNNTFSRPGATLQVISDELSNDTWSPVVNIAVVRQSLTTGRDSFGGIGFSSIDDSNNNGQYDAARIAVINESPASVITPTALAFYTNAGVSNSNAATEQVRINSSGSLGIGTNAPTHQLTVDETAGSSYALSARNTNDNLQIKLGTTTSGYANIQTTTISAGAAYNMALQAEGGNVGIGTNNPNIAKLQVQGSIYSNTSVQGANAVMKTYGGHAIFGSNSSTVPIALGRDAGNLDLVVSATGNVGIGQTSPANLLHIGSNTTGNNYPAVLVQSVTGYLPAIMLARGDGSFSSTGNSNWLIANSDNGFEISKADNLLTSTTSRDTAFQIDSSGNVGIGNISPSVKLHVSGTGYFSGGTAWNGGGSESNKTDIGLVIEENHFIYTRDSSQYLRKLIGKSGDYITIGESGTSLIDGISFYSGTSGNYFWYSNSAIKMHLNSDGNLGIGTTSPAQHLHVYSGATNIAAKFESNDGTGGIMLADSTGNVELTTSGTNGFNIQPGGGVSRFRVDGNGMISHKNSYTDHSLRREFTWHNGGVSNGTTVDLIENASAYTDITFIAFIELFHSSRTYRVIKGSFGGYGYNVTSSGNGLGLGQQVTGTGTAKLQFSNTSGSTASAHIHIIIYGDSSITVHNGYLSSAP